MHQYQNRIYTSLFREIDILRTAHRALRQKNENDLRILSFGCSIGDEVIALKWLFPSAELFACDINPTALVAATTSVGKLATVFFSDEASISLNGPYDLIVASAVLCVNPPKDALQRFPISKFDEISELFDSVLSVGGILAIPNTMYRFQDSPVGARYGIVRSDIVSSSGFVDVFSRDGRPFLHQIAVPGQRAYRFGAAFSITEDEELVDCMFRKSDGASRSVEMFEISPVPEGFQEIFSVTRSNLDAFSGVRPNGTIEVTTQFRFGVDLKTGHEGCAIRISWPSVVSDGQVHIRPETWSRMSGVSHHPFNKGFS